MFTSQQFEVLSFGDIDVYLRYKSAHPLQNVRYIFSPVLLVLQWMQTRVSSNYSWYSFWCFHDATSMAGHHSLRRRQLLFSPIYNIALHCWVRAEMYPGTALTNVWRQGQLSFRWNRYGTMVCGMAFNCLFIYDGFKF